MSTPKKVTGIGGIFFKCQNPEAVRTWYAQHLGLPTDDYGATFEWRHADKPSVKGNTVWGTFKAENKYFEPSTKEFMFNFRVENLDYLLEELKKEGIEPLGEVQEYDFGKFAHIMDPEGNKIELWQANDSDDSETITSSSTSA